LDESAVIGEKRGGVSGWSPLDPLKTAYLSRFHRRFHFVDSRHPVDVTKLSDRITAKHHVTVTFSPNDDGWVLTCSSCGRLEVVKRSWSRASER